MSHRKKRAIYKSLSNIFGDPTKLSLFQRNAIINLLGGWTAQHRDGAVRRRIQLDTNVSLPNRYKTTEYKVSIYEKAVVAAANSATQPNWHWKIRFLVQLPKQDAVNCRLGIPGIPTTYNPPAGSAWNYIEKREGKNLSIIIPMNYHIAVVPHGVSRIGKKIVQRIWNHRSYTDKEVWECTYWDFSKLGKEENSWMNAKWRTGFVVKMAVGSAVEESLPRALTVAHNRVVRAGINSILSDGDDED